MVNLPHFFLPCYAEQMSEFVVFPLFRLTKPEGFVLKANISSIKWAVYALI